MPAAFAYSLYEPSHRRLSHPETPADGHRMRRLLGVRALAIARGASHAETAWWNPNVNQTILRVQLLRANGGDAGRGFGALLQTIRVGGAVQRTVNGRNFPHEGHGQRTILALLRLRDGQRPFIKRDRFGIPLLVAVKAGEVAESDSRFPFVRPNLAVQLLPLLRQRIFRPVGVGLCTHARRQQQNVDRQNRDHGRTVHLMEIIACGFPSTAL